MILSLIAATSLALTAPLASSEQVDCLARIIHHEAGGESKLGQKAVAYVVLNRVHSKKFPKSICSVAQQKGQFIGLNLDKRISESKYAAVKKVALEAITEYSPSTDPTRGALYFHANRVKGSGRMTVRIGGHTFTK